MSKSAAGWTGTGWIFPARFALLFPFNGYANRRTGQLPKSLVGEVLLHVPKNGSQFHSIQATWSVNVGQV
jgi:hypothetical protein